MLPVLQLELDRALVAQRRMAPTDVVESLDVVGHRAPSFYARLQRKLVDELHLERSEEAFDNGVDAPMFVKGNFQSTTEPAAMNGCGGT